MLFSRKNLKTLLGIPIFLMVTIFSLFGIWSGTGKGQKNDLKVETESASVSSANFALGDETAVAFPTLEKVVKHTGSKVSPEMSYDSSKLQVSGTLEAANVGRYETSFTPKEGYAWGADESYQDFYGTQKTLTLVWEVHTINENGEGVFVPSIISSNFSAGDEEVDVPTFAYTGSAVTPALENFDSTKMNISGTQSATEVGTYSFSVQPKQGYFWENEFSNEALTFSWKISTSTYAINIEQSDIFYSGDAQSVFVEVVCENKILSSGTDYSTVITQSPKEPLAGEQSVEVKDAGTYYVHVVGQGDYEGHAYKTFAIEKGIAIEPTLKLNPIEGSGHNVLTCEEDNDGNPYNNIGLYLNTYYSGYSDPASLVCDYTYRYAITGGDRTNAGKTNVTFTLDTENWQWSNPETPTVLTIEWYVLPKSEEGSSAVYPQDLPDNIPALGGGSGTSEEPFLVATKEHLNAISTAANAGYYKTYFGDTGVYFKQTANITLSGTFTPIFTTAANACKVNYTGYHIVGSIQTIMPGYLAIWLVGQRYTIWMWVVI